MTTRPKRAFLSLKSMLVMCVVLSIFVSANAVERSEDTMVGFGRRGEASWENVTRVTNRGFPWSYRTDVFHFLRILDESGVTGAKDEAPFGYPLVSVRSSYLLLDLAIALLVSIALALASERFVFSKLRRDPPLEAREKK